MEIRGGVEHIEAEVPLATMFGYVSDLRTLTQGRAQFTMHFERYEAVPFAIAEEIVERRRSKRHGRN